MINGMKLLPRSILLLTLKGKTYTERGTFHDGQTVTSVLLPEFTVRVADVFDAAHD